MISESNIEFIPDPTQVWTTEDYDKAWTELTEADEANVQVFRMTMPGGFLVLTRDFNTRTTNLKFISKPDHSWNIG